MPRAFIIRPFDTKKDAAGKEVDFERIDRELISPALKAAGLTPGTTGKIVESGNIREDMFALIVEADLVVCDITIHNANVFYELGIRHALRKTRSVLIKGKPVSDSPTFDLLTDRYCTYDVDNPRASVEGLTDVIKATLASERETDSPIFKMLPNLPELEPSAVAQVVPSDLSAEIERAVAAKAAGWLRLLAADVAGFRFEWPALRLIGESQWQIGDYEGARRTWERVADNNPDDIAPNFALANLYERQYRRERKPEQMRASEQAIARILARGQRITVAQRAEALALEGRNQKTVWRLGLESVGDVAARRAKASSRALLKAYQAYHQAYRNDLNHYWPGLAALQLGVIILDLASDEDTWADIFDTTEEAKTCAEKVAREVQQLRAMVPLATAAALERLPRTHKDRVWAEISPADVRFLIEDNVRKVVRAYLDAVPMSNVFAWDAARGQLELFASLGIRADMAQEVIHSIEQVVTRDKQDDVHVVIFAGHQVDEPGRTVDRFPADREAKARELVREQLERLPGDGPKIEVLASAAPGGDILCHELCRELGMPSTICLPMPPDDYARLTFSSSALDLWRSRYFGLREKLPLLQLSDRPGLPKWLSGAVGIDPWERGNRWVLEMALTRGARKITLIALWDGKEDSALLGGTAHMHRIAIQSGVVDVVRIDAGQLLLA